MFQKPHSNKAKRVYHHGRPFSFNINGTIPKVNKKEYFIQFVQKNIKIKDKINMEKYPIYEVEFSDLASVFNNVSIVSLPAIMESFIKLSKQENAIQMKLDEEKHCVSGPVLIPEQLIYREMDGKKFYIKWSKETIEQVAINFFQNHRNTQGNVEHAINVNGVNFYESYIINKERGINPTEFSELPDGTWVLTAKITNDEVWQMIKSGELTGFSIDIENVEFHKVKPEVTIENLDQFLEYIKNNNK